ncbi:histidine phosphatase family protein [Kaustia mangrovi]|uniref:histidine phosphatase family protein n=1 Tax=Kaustia mangrovi TaxID=2593653 RepID=UPI002483E04F|nr:histidine phosphatase family protein [Kaustia mangrovi]
MTHPPLVFIRHGETDWNRERRLQGRMDIPLNALGEEQARAIGKRLSTILGDPDGMAFHVSPLIRARQTMTAVLDALGLPDDTARADDRLCEIDFGTWEGRCWPELNAHGIDRDADPEGYHAWRPDRGESYADATIRVADWLATLDRPAVVVAHGGIGRIVRGLSLGLAPAEIVGLSVSQWRFFRLAEGGIEWFDARPDRA